METEGKSLSMNASREEMEAIDKAIPSKIIDDTPEKLSHISYQSSAPIRMNVPMHPALETIGALCELETSDSYSSKESLESGDENSTDYRPVYFPKCLEDLIQLEHNYAANFINIFEREKIEHSTLNQENKNASNLEKVDVQLTKEVISVGKVTNLNICNPIRRSKRQIEKQRELTESGNVAVDDVLQNKVLGDLSGTTKQNNSIAIETNLSSNIENTRLEGSGSSCDPFVDLKKRCLKNLVEDCRSIQNLEASEASVTSPDAQQQKKSFGIRDPECKSELVINKDKIMSNNNSNKLLKKKNSDTSMEVEEMNTNMPLPKKRKIKSDLKIDEPSDSWCKGEKPIRRSKRQMEKQQELMEKSITVDDLPNEVLADLPETKKQNNSTTVETNLISNIENTESESGCLNFDSFVDRKKGRLKFVLKDNSSHQTLEDTEASVTLPDAQQNVSFHAKDTGNACELVINKEDSSEASNMLTKREFSAIVKTRKTNDIENMDINLPLLRKHKIIKSDPKIDVPSVSYDKEEHLEDIDLKNDAHKSLIKFDECEDKEKNLKNCKLSSVPSENNDIIEKSLKHTAVQSKRKKKVSFSDEVILHTIHVFSEKKQSLIDSNELLQKTVLPLPTSPIKSQKKKGIRRESFRLDVNEDEPPLFSQPDVMVKVMSDDVINKTEKDKDHDLSEQQDSDLKSQTLCSFVPNTNQLVQSVEEKIVEQNISKTFNDNHCHSPLSQSHDIKVKQSVLEHSTDNVKIESINDDECNAHLTVKLDSQEGSKSSDSEKCQYTSNNKQDVLENSSSDNYINANDVESSNEQKNKTNVNIEVSDAEEFKPERKSRRIIKRKEFFEDVLDARKTKKTLKPQNGDQSFVHENRNSIIKTKDEKTEESSDVEITTDMEESEEDDPDKLWCICRKPHNARFMIQCDKCEDWFHGTCVGVTKAIGRQLEKLRKEWWCPNCSVSDQPMLMLSKMDGIFENCTEFSKGIDEGPLKKDKNFILDDRHSLIEPTADNSIKAITKVKQSVSKPTGPFIKSRVSDVKLKDIDMTSNNGVELRKSEAKPSDPRTKPRESQAKTRITGSKPKEPDTKLTNSKPKVACVKLKEAHSKNFNLMTVKRNLDANLANSAKTSKHGTNLDVKKVTMKPKSKLLSSSSSSSQKHVKHLSFKSKKFNHASVKSTSKNKFLNASSQNLFSPNDASHSSKPMKKKTTLRNTGNQVLPTKILNFSNEKGAVNKKKQNCVQCQLEAKLNSCYCSDNCIDKHIAECFKSMHETKGTPKGAEFDFQRLVVFDRMKGNVITNGPTTKEIASWLKKNPSFSIVFTPSTKKEHVLQKKECDSSTGLENKDGADEAAKATVRLNVKKTLKNILVDRCKNADDIQLPDEDVQRIANKIEEELHDLFKDNTFKYRAKYRSLMFNIKDPRNQGLFRKILKGNIPPNRLVCMSSEDLASIELAKWREQENQHLLDLIKREQLEHQKTGTGLLLKKTHKGEIEIEDDLTSIIEADLPKDLPKDIPEEVIELEEEVKNTTHLHRSHLFDLNCKICTGKIVPPPGDESIPKKVRVAHSISVDNNPANDSDSVERTVSRIVEGKSPVSSAGDDSMDQVPTSTVSIGSPEINVKSSSKNFPSKAVTSVWKGFILMQDIAKFVASAYKVSGQTDHLRQDLPDTIQVCGRIIPDQVWDYLGKIKQSGNKELIVIHFQPANDEEAVAYHSFYSYLSSRKRYGVVSNYSKKIKDFYLLPLAAASPVPMVLVPFDGPGLPSPRPHLLLGVIVCHKFKQATTAPAVKQTPVSKMEVIKKKKSGTLSREHSSYTPPLVESPDESPKQDSDTSYSPVEIKINCKLDLYQTVDSKNCKTSSPKTVSELPCSSITDEPFDSDIFSSVKDEDKPYDPEQDILSLMSDRKENKSRVVNTTASTKPSDNLEQHKKILDALTRQVEETDRQVNALKQLISVPEEVIGVQSPASIDIASVAETGMSSFLDLPENLQEILNNVKLNSSEEAKNIHEKGDVDMRIKDLFSQQIHSKEDDKVIHSAHQEPDVFKSKEINQIHSKLAHSSQSATPPPDKKNDSASASYPSDPRIKLRTSLQVQSFKSDDPSKASSSATSKQAVPIQKKLMDKSSVTPFLQESKNCSTVTTEFFSPVWVPGKEPPPPGISISEPFIAKDRIDSVHSISNPFVPVCHAQTYLQNTIQELNSIVSQPIISFPTHLSQGFSVNTPPPVIQHFPSIMTPPFIPPQMPVTLLPPEGNDINNKDSWPVVQHSNYPLQSYKQDEKTSQWNKSDEHQGTPQQSFRQHSSEKSNEYQNDNFFKRDPINKPWKKTGQARGQWNRHRQRGNRIKSRTRGSQSFFRRNQRN